MGSKRRVVFFVGAVSLALVWSMLSMSPTISSPANTTPLGAGVAHTIERAGATWAITDEVFDATGPDLDGIDPAAAGPLRVAPVEEPAIAVGAGVFGSGRATPGGDFSLPTDRAAWPDFTADLAGVRFTIRGNRVDIDVRYTSMSRPDAQLATVTFSPAGTPGPARAWPAGAGVRSPWLAAATIGGRSALLHAANGTRAMTTEVADHTTSVSLPLAALPPRPWVVAVGSGLADPAEPLRYLAVPPGAATPASPGARGIAGAVALWDIAQVGPGWAAFGEREQAALLATGDLSQALFEISTSSHHALDRAGTVTRNFASRWDGGDGIVRDPSGVAELGPPPIDAPLPDAGPMTGWMYTGRLQRYAVHVPPAYDESRPAPLVVYLHGFGGDVSEPFDAFPDLVMELAARGYLVAAPLGRGDTFYRPGPGELDVLEAIADVAANYAIDPDRIFLFGFSGGSAGVNVLTSRHPDLFAGAISAAATFEEPTLVDNVGSLPWLGLMAEGDPVSQALDGAGLYQALSDRGADATLVRYAAKTHEFSMVYDSVELIVGFLERHRRDATPPQVTWVVKPADARPALGLERGGSWWVSDTTVADDAQTATVSARTFALGRAPADPTTAARTEEVVDMGGRSRRSVARLFTTRPRANPQTSENRLDVRAVNVAAVAIDLPRAGLTTDAPLAVHVELGTHVVLELVGTADVLVSLDGGPSTLVKARRGRAAVDIPAGVHTLRVIRQQ